MWLVLLALVLVGCLVGCAVEDGSDAPEEEVGSVEEGTDGGSALLNITVCFEGQPCPGRKGGSNP